MKSSTTPIVYHCGSYGTYLEWALTTLTDPLQKLINPLNTNGNSHKFKGHHLNNISGWREYLTSTEMHPLVRLHPKVSKQESIFENFAELGKSVNSFVYLHPDEKTLLLCLSNQYTKVRDSCWDQQFESFEIDKNKIYSNWPVKNNDPIPVWVQREFLSLYIMPMWFDQIEYGNSRQFTHPKCINLSVYDLLFHFENSIGELSRKLNLNLLRSIDILAPIHANMIAVQKNIGIDQLCKDIINSLVNNQSFNWNPISIIGESWIQWQLRNLGYEVRCNGLDIFPTNSVQLQELIYKV